MQSAAAEAHQFWRKQHKHRAIQAFGNRCLICQQTYNDSAYDFHHIDATKKNFGIAASFFGSRNGWDIIRDELLKCILLCSNCHRMWHNSEIIFEVENKIYFDMKYYEWDDLKDISIHSTIKPVEGYSSHKDICKNCGIILENFTITTLCRDCYNIAQRTVERPSREQFKSLIRTESFTALGKLFGVCNTSIRKWCIAYNLPFKKTEIKKYSNEEWSKF